MRSAAAERAWQEIAKDRQLQARSTRLYERPSMQIPTDAAAKSNTAELSEDAPSDAWRNRFATAMARRADATLPNRQAVLDERLCRPHESALWNVSEGWPMQHAACDAVQSDFLQQMVQRDGAGNADGVNSQSDSLAIASEEEKEKEENLCGSEISDDVVRFTSEQFEAFLDRNRSQFL